MLHRTVPDPAATGDADDDGYPAFIFGLPDSGEMSTVIAPDLSNLPPGQRAIDPVTGEIGLHATPTVVKDVVIVGGGFAGLACARSAALRGLSVLVLDRQACAGQVIHTTGLGVSAATVTAIYSMTLGTRYRPFSTAGATD